MSAIHKDDPRITAFALAEPTAIDAREHTINSTLISEDPELRHEVDAVRAFGNELEQAFIAELSNTPRLSAEQQQAIKRTAAHAANLPFTTAGNPADRKIPRRNYRAPHNDDNPPHKQWRTIGAWGLFSAAAAAIIALIIAPVLSPTRSSIQQHDGNQLAMKDKSVPTSFAEASPPITITTINPPINQGDPLDSESFAKQLNFELANELTMEEKQAHLATVTQTSNKALASQGDSSEKLEEAEMNKGREEAVAASETGSTGAFMAIGAGGRTPGVRARRPGLSADSAQPIRPDDIASSGETYMQRANNTFYSSRQSPLSTFGLDVDTASYANVRRMINDNRLPHMHAVRIEEMINYFPYDIPKPTTDKTFGITVEVAPCPWQPAHQLARIAIRGKSFPATQRPPLNLVFLVDVSGSMGPINRLPLIKSGLTLLANTLTGQDNLSIITYAGSAQVLLPATNGTEQAQIMQALSVLNAGGSTNGGQGIYMAYEAAHKSFIPDGVNRVILCTDGDFNVGITGRESLVQLAQKQADNKIFLTVLGVGENNLKDATMEQLADRANGHYHYLDSIAEARKVLLEQIGGTLVTIAKDVKAQIEFNPARIAEYRQVGYEKRQLAAKDFNDDKKDAGEIGADHQVTILYELIPTTAPSAVDGLRYQNTAPPAPIVTGTHTNELMTVKIRFKEPNADKSQLIQGIVTDDQVRAHPSIDQRFVSAVAAFALRLRGTTEFPITWEAIEELAESGIGSDAKGYRKEFIELLQKMRARH